MPKVLTIVGVSILVLGLVLGIASPILAAPHMPKPWAEDFQAKIVQGKVTSINEANQQFVIKSGEEELTIRVNEETKYYKLPVPGRITSLARRWLEFRHQNQEETRGKPEPNDSAIPEPSPQWFHPFGEEAVFSDIAVGDKVLVWAEENGNLLAKWVLITKVTNYASVSGTITDVSPASITITPEDGDPVTLSYNENTVFTLKGVIQVVPGQSARAIYDSDNLLAKRVTVPQEVVEPAD
jgi:hypothetical protein